MESPAKKLEQINVRLTGDDKAQIVAMAQRTGRPITDLMFRGALRYGEQLLRDRERMAGRPPCPR